MHSRPFRQGLGFGLALAALLTPTAAAGEKLVVEAGRILPIVGPEIVDGVIVIEDGRITSIGPAGEIEKPWDAPVVGGPEFVAFPGFVEAHTSDGIDRANENIDVTPFLDIRDSIDPIDFYFEESLRWGITTINIQQGADTVIAGRGRIVKPGPMTVEEMTVRPTYGIKLSAAPKSGKSRATQAQALRQAFGELREHLEQLVVEKREGSDKARREALYQGRDFDEPENAKGRAIENAAWAIDGFELVPRGEVDEKLEPLLHLIEGRYAAFVHCSLPMDVHRALEICRENGFLTRTTLVLSPACWKAAEVIAEAGVPVVLDGDLTHVERDARTGKEIETFVPKVYEDAGVRYALSAENSANRSLWYQAALAVGGGVERQKALEAVTLVPAEILGVGDRVGGLAKGMDGNVLLLTGDPLDVTTWVDRVVIEGKVVYDRDEDTRNIHLLQGLMPPGTRPATAADLEAGDGVEEEGDDDEHGDEESEEEPEEPEEDEDDDEGDDEKEKA